MYGIFTYIYHKNQPNVGEYTKHGSYGKHNTAFYMKKHKKTQQRLICSGWTIHCTYMYNIPAHMGQIINLVTAGGFLASDF